MKFGVEAIVFTGVAGGLKQGQRVGDIVIATDCVNYDMDVTAFVPFPGCSFARGQVGNRQNPAIPASQFCHFAFFILLLFEDETKGP